MKAELRRQLRARMAAIDRQDLLSRSASACRLLAEQEEFRAAQTIMAYLSLPYELDTSALVLRAWEGRRRVLAPKVDWEQRRMLPIEIRSLTTGLVEGKLGLREPAQGAPVPVGDIDLLVVPGLGFDRSGNRLGRGRGFYDRFLTHRDFRGVACGLALEDQVLPEVPALEGDSPVDMLVTEREVLRFPGRRPRRRQADQTRL